MLRRLPLQALRSFDVAARRLSYAAAADALGLTPSAVSHQIRNLERLLGVQLFTRRARGVALTEAGERFAVHVRKSFLAMARGVAAIRDEPRMRQLRVTSLALFNQLVLIPGLADFAARHPGLELRVEASRAFADFEAEDFDVGVRVGSGQWPGLAARRLLDITGLPVASPDLLAHTPIHCAADIAACHLIHDAAQPRGWRRWLAAHGVDREPAPGDLWFDSEPQTLQAAEHGLGVALGIDPLIRAWPGFGERLAPAFRAERAPVTAYWLVWRADAGDDPRIRMFASWLQVACEPLRASAVEGPSP